MGILPRAITASGMAQKIKLNMEDLKIEIERVSDACEYYSESLGGNHAMVLLMKESIDLAKKALESECDTAIKVALFDLLGWE